MLIAVFVAVALVAGTAAALGVAVWQRGWSVELGPPVSFELPDSWRLAALAAAVLAPTLALGIFISSSAFVWDDITNLRQAQLESLSRHYLLEPTSGHFAPGHRLVDWLLERLFPFNFTVAEAVLLIAFVLTLLAFHRLLAELFRPGAGPLLLTLFYGASLVHVGVAQWWSSGMDRLPATLFSFAAMVLYLRYWRTRAWPYLAASVVSLLAAEMFYVKPVFVPLYLVLIRVLLLEPDRPVRETIADAAREWPVWSIYAAVVGVFGVVYVRAYPTGLNQSTTAGVLAKYLGILWSRVAVPNFFGLWVPMHDVSPAIAAAAVASHVVLLGVVVLSIRRWPPAWRAWAFFAVTFLVNAVIVGATRVGLFAAKIIAYTVYFNLEGTFLFVIALGAAFLRPRAGSPASPSPDPVDRWPAPGTGVPTAVAGALAVGVAAYLALSWWGGYRISQPGVWIGARSRHYLDAATAGLRQVPGSSDAALVDGVVPDDVMPYLLVPYNSASEVFSLIDDRLGFEADGRPLYDVTPRGRVRAVSFVPDAGGDVVSLLQHNQLGVLGATPRFEDGALCVTTSTEAASIGFVPPTPLSGGDVDLRLVYDARTPFAASLIVDPRPVITSGISKGQTKFRVVNVKAGHGRARVYGLDAPLLRSLFIVVAPHAELCIRDLELGHLAARQ